ncbi:MAG: DUF4173 domain-containing protein [Gemmatimonadaceae bacterium]
MTTSAIRAASPESTLAGFLTLTRAERADAPPATTLLWQAVLLGISGDALLRQGPIGPALAVWVGVMGMAVLSLTWSARRTMPRQAAGWLGTALLFAILTAWRNSELLQVLDFLSVVGALGLAALALRDRGLALWASRLRDTIWGAAAVVLNVMRGVLPLAVRELFRAEHGTGWQRRTRAIVRASLIAGVLAIVFGSLLRSADPVFAQLVRLPDLDFEIIASHIFLTGFFAWTTGGWAYAALVAHPSGWRAPERLPVTLGTLEVTTALATLNVLFGAFVLTQLGWFFGGERFLSATTGLTAAEYARQGFFQMVWVVVLVVPLLLATRAAMSPDPALARRHTSLSLPVVALLGTIIVSAALRMRLYVHYYGLSTDRLTTLVFMGWLFFVLALLAATVLRGRGGAFVAGSVLSGLAVLAALHIVTPDLVVARVNIARAAETPHDARTALDVHYLTRLSAEAAELATVATLAPPNSAIRSAESDAARCAATATLLTRWGPGSAAVKRATREGAWRTWNAGEVRALHVVGANVGALVRLRHEVCGRTRRGATR